MINTMLRNPKLLRVQSLLIACMLTTYTSAQLYRPAIGAYKTPRVQIQPTSTDYIIVKEFDDVTMTCTASGHPTPTVRWSFVAGALSRRNLDPTNPQLFIRKITRFESGRVTCRAENGIGNPSFTTKTIKVYYLDTPTFSIHPSKLEASKTSIWYENTVYLTCEVRSYPPATFIWWKNRRRIRPDKLGRDVTIRRVDPYKPEVSSVVMKIDDAKVGDYGAYKCQASIDDGRGPSIKDKSANFTYTSRIAPPEIALRNSANLVVNKGDRVNIACDVINGFPRPTITWIRKDGILPVQSEVVKKRNLLRLNNVQIKDSGTYYCVGNNNVGLPVSKSTQIIVRYIKPIVYWITPDPLQDDRQLALGSDMKMTCHADASPYSELQYSWFKLNSDAERVEVLNGIDPDISITSLDTEEVKRGFTYPEKSSRLKIQTLTRDDYGQYVCMAQLRGQKNMSVSATITITSDSAPAQIRREVSPVLVREGELAKLKCFSRGKPKPLILWRRDENMTMPSGNVEELTKDGILTIPSVSRDDAGLYTCTSARYNGFSKLRKQDYDDDVELIVLYPPTVERTSFTIRTRVDARQVVLSCNVIDASPINNLTYIWKKDGVKIATSTTSETMTLSVISPSSYATYACDVINSVGTATCVINVTGQAYAPEFLSRAEKAPFSQKSPPGTFSYLISWTQKFPDDADAVSEYRVRWRQLGGATRRDTVAGDDLAPVAWKEKQKVPYTVAYGEVITCKLDDLVSGNYEVEVTPKTNYGYGDPSSTVIQVRSERSANGIGPTLQPSKQSFFCSFDQSNICGFTQDTVTDQLNWRWNNARNQARRTPNTGPESDHSYSDVNGGYMYIEASSTRGGDIARLLTPFVYNEKSSQNCFKFFYNMRGSHIGVLRILQFSDAWQNETELWRREGEQGDSWLFARFTVSAKVPYRIIFEAEMTRDNGYEGDIAVDDVLFTSGGCPMAPTQASPQKLTSTAGNSAKSHMTFKNIDWSPVATAIYAKNNPIQTLVLVCVTGIYGVFIVFKHL